MKVIEKYMKMGIKKFKKSQYTYALIIKTIIVTQNYSTYIMDSFAVYFKLTNYFILGRKV